MAEGFPIIATQDGTITTPTELFPSDITFPDVPNNFLRELQFSVWAGSSSVLSIVFNGVNYAINNGVAVQGAVVFTVLVGNGDTVNFTTNGTSVPLRVTILGG